MNKYHCPNCGRFLSRTEDEGLWCENGCYESSFALWEALQVK